MPIHYLATIISSSLTSQENDEENKDVNLADPKKSIDLLKDLYESLKGNGRLDNVMDAVSECYIFLVTELAA